MIHIVLPINRAPFSETVVDIYSMRALDALRTLFSIGSSLPHGRRSPLAWVTYIESDGTAHTVNVATGNSVMQGAVDHDIRGIVAECGGGLACATCHCYVDAAWIDTVGPASDTKQQMLECVAADRTAASRLSCQITVDDALSGLIVRLPKAQY